MAKTTKKTTRTNKKNKLHLKKSARWTIAGLMLATAVIIALIPVQNGGVSAKSNESSLPTVDDLSYDFTSNHLGSHAYEWKEPGDTTSQHVVKGEDVSGKPGLAFPYVETITTENDIDGKTHTYYKVLQGDGSGMPSVPVPIFKLGKNSSTGDVNYINQYIGGGESGFNPPGGTVSLSDKIVVNNGIALPNPYYSGNATLANEAKENKEGRSADGQYSKYTETLITQTKNGNEYELIRVDKVTVDVTLERDEDNNPILVDPSDPSKQYKYTFVETYDTPYYACKDSDGNTDALIDGINFISDGAFKDAGHIKTITIPSNINAVGNSAFENSGIESANIDKLCKFIGDRAFYNCQSLRVVNFSEDQGDLRFIGNCAFANTKLGSDENGNPGVIPFKVPKSNNLVIGSGAFYNCTYLGNVDFSNTNSTISLGCYTFAGDYNLTNVDLKNVGTIINHSTSPDNAQCGIFSQCGNLSEVTFDNTFSDELPYGTFADCPNLYYVKFKNGNATFHTIENSLTTPHTYESDFKGLNNNFHIWGNGADDSLHRLCTKASITYRYYLDPPDDKNFEYFDKYGYKYSFSPIDGSDNYIITSIDDTNVSSTDTLLDIPYSICDYYNITQIGPNACKDLKKKLVTQVNIPDSIEAIGDQAFADMTSLKTVLFTHNRSTVDGSDIPQAASLTIGADAFYKDKNLEDIYLRHYEYESDGTIKEVYDPKITSIGTSEKNGKTVGAFYTERESGTTIHGAMYDRFSENKDAYYPFLYCMDESLGKCNNKNDGYVLYVTDGPELLSAQYKKGMNGEAGASLLSYPTKYTKVKTGIQVDSSTGEPVLSGGEYVFDECTLEDMVRNLSTSSPDYNFDVRDAFETIYVPKGITTIEDLRTINYSPENDIVDYFQNLKPIYNTSGEEISSTKTIVIADVKELPDRAFSSELNSSDPSQTTLNDIVPSSLRYVVFENDLYDIGEKPFLNSKNLTNVLFSNSENPATDSEGIKAGNKSYSTDGNGMIYCTEYDSRYSPEHEDRTLVCYLPGYTATSAIPESDITRIEDSCFENCDQVFAIDLTACEKLREETSVDASGKVTIHSPVISENFAYDADSLGTVLLPETVTSIGKWAFSPEENHKGSCLEDVINVTIPCYDTLIDEEAFQYNTMATLRGYPGSAAQRHANDVHPTHPKSNHYNIKFDAISELFNVTFLDQTGQIIGTPEKVKDGEYVQEVPTVTPPTGYKFVEWRASGGKKVTDAVHSDIIFVPIFEPEESSSSSSSSSGSSSSTGSGSSSGSGSSGSGSSSSSTNKSSSSSSSSANKSSSASSTNNRPVVISGAPTPVVQPGSANSSASGGAASSSPSGSNVTTGNTNVVSTAPGLSNNGKMSATVNGSSDNYVIKLTETAEADECAKQALSAAFGSLDNIRYMPFDISLYDSTGTQKISPVPEGVTVSVTMPIPDSLQVYGGNNKVASTVGGTLESIKPRFTVIDGVPCMNFTVSHLSPYVIYVDTANLTASGTLDATPKTGDPIHPKWFLCIGLTAISIFLFLKRDKDTLRAA